MTGAQQPQANARQWLSRVLLPVLVATAAPRGAVAAPAGKGATTFPLQRSDLVIATFVDAPSSPDIIKAGTACRKGVRTYVATNQSVYLSNPPGDYYNIHSIH